MKQLIYPILFFLLIAPVKHLNAQLKIALPPAEMRADVSLREGRIAASYDMSHFRASEITVNGSDFVRISFPGSFPSGSLGMPQIPVFSSLIETFPHASYTFKILSVDSVLIDLDELFPGVLLLPVQESKQKGTAINPEFILGYTTNPGNYNTSANALLTVENQGIMRGVSIGRLEFNPFRYDPELNQLTVYYSASFEAVPEIQYPGSTSDIRSSVFERALSPVIRNSDAGTLKRLVSEEPVTMVILSDSIFRDALQPLVEWKTEKGFRVIEAYTNDPEVGNTNSSIRAYLQQIYNDPPQDIAPPSYLLIAGDVEHVPLSQSSGQITDLYYTTFDGEGDYLPEIFHGRISVKNDTQLTNVVNKILLYEKYQFPDPSFLNRSILIAGYDASYASVHGNGQINYASEYYFNSENGITANVYLHPQAASLDHEILDDISAGAALVNYTGHGEYYGWIDPAFRLGNIDTLKNIAKYGLVIGNGCSTNQFNLPSQDCFAEAIIKAKDRGAIGYIGCTNDSYWDEDYYWSVGVGPFSSSPSYEETSQGYYDKLFHLGNEPVESWCPSLGEMIFAGNMTVQQSASIRKEYYWEIYQIMGDPSLVPWFRVPDDPEVEYPSAIPDNTSAISIVASPYDYIALSAEGNLIHAMHANQFGQATFSLPESVNGLDLKLVVSGDYRQPFSDSIYRSNELPGYLELLTYSLVNESEIQDELISIGEEFSLALSIVNNSSTAITGEELIIESSSDFISVSDSVYIAESIPAGDTLVIPVAFRITAGIVPSDNTAFTLSIRRKSQAIGNVIFIREEIHRSTLNTMGINWNDRAYGNGNGKVDAGEKILFEWTIRNDGSYSSDQLSMQWGPNSSAFFTDFASDEFPAIPPGGQLSILTTARVVLDPSSNKPFQLSLQVDDEAGQLSDSLTIVIGRHFEDFSTGDLSNFKWINSEAGWKIDSLYYDGPPYSLRSGIISHSQSSSLKIALDLPMADTLSFSYRVSSEAGYDYLRFYLDSVQIEKWSGEKGWKQYSIPIDSGNHLLEWRYQKDTNTERGEDAAWIDNVIFPANSFNRIDLGLLTPLSPNSSRSLAENEEVVLRVANTGQDTVSGFSVGYQLEDMSPVSHLFSDTLLPGQDLEILFDERIDLSEIRSYSLKAFVMAEGDRYPGNDSAIFVIDHYSYPDLGLVELGIDSTSDGSKDLIIEVSNQGNILIEKIDYTYLLDGYFRRDSSVEIDLAPGNSREIVIRLFEVGDDSIADGWHEYSIVAAEDSLIENNTVSGSFFYKGVQSIGKNSANYFLLYPNPIGGEFSINLGNEITLPAELTIFSVNGGIIYSSKIQTARSSFDSGTVFKEDGLYFIRIVGDGGSYSSGLKVYVHLQK